MNVFFALKGSKLFIIISITWHTKAMISKDYENYWGCNETWLDNKCVHIHPKGLAEVFKHSLRPDCTGSSNVALPHMKRSSSEAKRSCEAERKRT